MATSVLRQLPAQPTSGGVVNYVPLGGDGFLAPHAAYAVSGFKLAGTNTGGAAKFTLEMDPRFVSLMSYVTLGIQQDVAADAEIAMVLNSGDGHVPHQRFQASVVAIASDVSTPQVSATWGPNPFLMPGGAKGSQLTVSMLNVDAFDYFLSCWILLFDINVREKSPMGPLLWARGSSGGSVT